MGMGVEIENVGAARPPRTFGMLSNVTAHRIYASARADIGLVVDGLAAAISSNIPDCGALLWAYARLEFS